jgi:hypothetical protein
MRTFREYLTESADTSKAERWLTAAAKVAWKDMDTKKGKWFAKNAPAKLVAKALDMAVLPGLVKQVATLAAAAMKDKPELKSIDAVVDSNTPAGNKIIGVVTQVQKAMYKQVAEEGDEPEWKDKWGDRE